MSNLSKQLPGKEALVACRQMSFAVHNLLGPICRSNNVTPQQFYILSELSANPGQTVTQLCENTGILRTNFTIVCNKMIDRGLLEKNKNAMDKRSFTLQLTEDGQRLANQMEASLNQALEPLSENVSEQVFEDLQTGFHAMQELLSALPDQTKARRMPLRSRRARARQGKED